MRTIHDIDRETVYPEVVKGKKIDLAVLIERIDLGRDLKSQSGQPDIDKVRIAKANGCFGSLGISRNV